MEKAYPAICGDIDVRCDRCVCYPSSALRPMLILISAQPWTDDISWPATVGHAIPEEPRRRFNIPGGPVHPLDGHLHLLHLGRCIRLGQTGHVHNIRHRAASFECLGLFRKGKPLVPMSIRTYLGAAAVDN